MTYKINIAIIKDTLPDPDGEYNTCNFRITTTSNENSDVIFIDNINCMVNKDDAYDVIINKVNNKAMEFIENKYGELSNIL